MGLVAIHEKNITTFNSLGLGALLPSSCTVKEELNGMYELEVSHPYDEWGKWKRFEEERILYASTPKGCQPFRIYKIVPNMKGIRVYARHVFYDLLDNLCLPVSANEISPQTMLGVIQGALAYETEITFETAMTGTGEISLTHINPVAALLSDDEDTTSFVRVFGGELERDHFKATFVPSTGRDRGFVIRYGKNLIGMEVTEDISDVATRIYPFGKDGKTILDKYIDSPYLGNYQYPKILVHEDISLKTASELKEAVQKLFDGKCDLPKVNIKVNFQLLSKTEAYKDFAFLEKVFIGDVVTTINPKMGFSRKGKVISYSWDCLLEKYDEVEIGDFVEDLTSSVSSGKKSLSAAMNASTEVKQVYGLLSGKITVNGDGLYICVDGTGINDATKLFHFGTQGLRHSSTGKDGTWTTIISGNGVIL